MASLMTLWGWLGAVLFPSTVLSFASSAEKETLTNGLLLIFEHNDTSASTFLQLLIRGGMRAEPAEKKGLSFLATRLAVEVPDSSKAQELLRLASTFSVSSRGDYSLINIECLTAGLEPTLRILGRIVASPLFTSFRIDSVKKYMAHQSNVEKDDSQIVGHQAALSIFFGYAGYGGSAYGDPSRLKEIRNRDVSSFYKSHFTSSNMVLSVSSDLKKEAILDLLERTFGSLPRGEPVSLPSFSPLPPEKKEIFIPKETKQSLVSLAFPLARIEPRRYALNELLRYFLGHGSGSKIWPLRSEEKLAYNVNCRVTQMLEGGVLEAYLETEPAKKEKALLTLKEILVKVREDGLTEEELEAAKAVTKTEFLRDNESKQARASTRGSFEILGLGFDYATKFLEELNSIALEEVNAYVREILDLERAIVIEVGPAVESRDER